MRICIIGGGNVGTLMAAEFTKKGHDVTIYTSRPHLWADKIKVYDKDDKLLFVGRPKRATSSINEAIKSAQLIFVTFPPFLFSGLADMLLPILQKDQKLVFVPGSGGVEEAFKNLIKNGIEVWGLQRVPDIARLKEPGASVYALGRKSRLKLATIPSTKCTEAAQQITTLFGIPCDTLPSYVCVTLSPSNQILHTSRLCSMFADYEQGKTYDRQFLFYREWDDAASVLLFQNDSELQKLCATIPGDLSSIEPLPIYYESPTPEALTRKIRSIQAFRDIKTPMTHVDKGWIPDFNSRYFMADFPYGLNIIRQLAHKYGVNTPSLDATWHWYLNVTGYHAKA